MPKLLNTTISRRSLLKVCAISTALLTLPLWGTRAIAQSAGNTVAKAVQNQPEGLVSFNAGWAIPLEDKPALLVLEEKKIKEAEAAAPKSATANASAGTEGGPAPKSNKTWGDKIQDAWSKVKGIF